jgi:hypothetical protein
VCINNIIKCNESVCVCVICVCGWFVNDGKWSENVNNIIMKIIICNNNEIIMWNNISNENNEDERKK